MKIIDDNIELNNKNERERMKSLFHGIEGDISRLLADEGFGKKPIKIVELIAFAMYIIADTYILAKSDKNKAKEILKSFYYDVHNYFINDIIINDQEITDIEDIHSISDKFHDIINRRFLEYTDKFQQDIFRPLALSCPNTVNYLLDNLFMKPISKKDKNKMLIVLSDKIIYLRMGCRESFK